MNIFKNLMFLQGHFVDARMDDGYAQRYGRADETAPSTTPAKLTPEATRGSAARAADGPMRATTRAALSKAPADIEYLDVYYTSR